MFFLLFKWKIDGVGYEICFVSVNIGVDLDLIGFFGVFFMVWGMIVLVLVRYWFWNGNEKCRLILLGGGVLCSVNGELLRMKVR